MIAPFSALRFHYSRNEEISFVGSEFSMTEVAINAGDTAWVLASSALVLLMTPGLAFFYGGMVRAKSALNMMMMSMITIAFCIVAGK